MQVFTNLLQVETMAREMIEPGAFDYITGGSDDEISLRRNREDFDRYVLRTRVLIDVSRVDTSTTVLGTPVSLPVLLAPVAAHKLCCEEGELATARAAAAEGTISILSTVSTVSMEDVAAAADGPMWFQLYVYKDREVTRDLVQRAEAAGYRGLCLTVDVPVIGNRERDVRNSFTVPYPLANLVQAHLENMPTGMVGSGLGAYASSKWDPSLCWDDVDWMASITKLPIILKGILTGEDARLALDHGVAAIIVSNHGGRQLDSVESGIMALPEVVDAVGGRVEVPVDGGIRRGTDVIKCLALGARAVLIGRPYMYGLAVGGEEGVRRVLHLLRLELGNAMMLTGRPTIGDINSTLVRMRS
jgi:4-hydroxymandelate oxidase